MQPATPQEEQQSGGVDTTSYSNGPSGTETLCADVDWPAQYTWAYHQYRRGYHGPYSWMGSLAFGMRDASGLHYRRNRFYDAEQGRFTQEDPIGLAGGINLYGYANGDPATYSYPYGLSAGCDPPSKCPLDFGGGYRGRVDTFTREGVPQHEIHVYSVNPAGAETEVGIFGKDGWIARHQHDGSAPNIPRSVLAKINGQNVTELRRQGVIRPRGQQNIAGGAYSTAVARLFGRVNSVGTVMALPISPSTKARREAWE